MRDQKLMDKFVRDIIAQLHDGNREVKHIGSNLDFIDVEFYCGKGKRPIGTLGITLALNSLIDGVFHFEDFDITDADRVVVVSH